MTLATVMAMVLGIERDAKRKPIDFRAFGIIALASCVLAILAQELYADFSSSDHILRLDLANIISGVLTGIGFLGAGAIIKHRDGAVVGTATGASIWASGALGLLIGFGFYGLALSMFVLLVLILVGGSIISRFLSTSNRD
ncbi:MAG: MgtC/SapB family protein [Gammaproteobacteria bacterium]|nr:MgtC/SapB family protein [Gammaproteobacteria bacterium]